MGFKVKVGDTVVYETEETPEEITSVSFLTLQGEAGRIGSPITNDTVSLIFETRDLVASDYLDVVGKQADDARREAVEAAGKKTVKASKSSKKEESKEESLV